MKFILLLILLCLYLSMSGAQQIWKNQLGSTVIFNFEEDGTLNGTYTTGVGAATSSEPLTGYWSKGEYSILVGFTVAWRHNKEGSPLSLTSWTGAILQNDQMKTTWILVSDVEPASAWKNSVINQDVFQKCFD